MNLGTSISPPSAPATGSFYGLHHKSNCNHKGGVPRKPSQVLFNGLAIVLLSTARSWSAPTEVYWTAPEHIMKLWTDGISLTVTPDGVPHIAYLTDNTSMYNTVFHARRATSGWDVSSIEVVSGVSYINSCPSITADATGGLHVAYLHNESNRLHYGYSSDGGDAWSVVDVGPSGWGCDIALQSDLNPVVSHSGLRVSQPASNTWTTVTVTGATSINNTGVAVDAANNIHVAFISSDSQFVSYVFFDSATSKWHPPVAVEYVGTLHYRNILDIALDSTGNPAITYYDEFLGRLRYAARNGSDWNIVTVDTNAFGIFCLSLRFGTDGAPRICYTRGGNLCFAQRIGNTWSVNNLDVTPLGDYAAMCLDSYNLAHVVYVKGNPNALYYARQLPSIAEVAITSLRRTPQKQVQLDWKANRPDMDFTVEFSPSLTKSSWQPFPPADQWPVSVTSWTSPSLNVERLFFRVSYQPR